MGMKNTTNYVGNNGKPITAVFDKGRRGNPLLGCDCVQCFGYCLIDGDQAARERWNRERALEKKDEAQPA
jgi:hypothetical protein